ncbi:MAG: hypothetical protein GY847_01710 [Proteobacteria bacterium]|nr:hypothetical protein [Pseudomonadota bacterium]
MKVEMAICPKDKVLFEWRCGPMEIAGGRCPYCGTKIKPAPRDCKYPSRIIGKQTINSICDARRAMTGDTLDIHDRMFPTREKETAKKRRKRK